MRTFIFQVRTENHHLKEKLSSVRHNLDAKTLLLRSLQLQITSYKAQRERQQQIFKQRRHTPSTSIPSPSQTHPVDPGSIESPVTQTAMPEHGQNSSASTPQPVSENTAIAATVRATSQPSHTDTTSTTPSTITRTAKRASDSSSNNDSDNADRQSSHSSSETKTDTSGVDSDTQRLLRSQNRALSLEINRLRKQIVLLRSRKQRVNKTVDHDVQTQVETAKKKKGKKHKKKSRKINSKTPLKIAKTAYTKNKFLSTSTQTTASNADPGGTAPLPNQPHSSRTDHLRQARAQNQLTSLRGCVLEVLGSILRGNEALRHRLLDLQLGDATNTTYAEMGALLYVRLLEIYMRMKNCTCKIIANLFEYGKLCMFLGIQ